MAQEWQEKKKSLLDSIRPKNFDGLCMFARVNLGFALANRGGNMIFCEMETFSFSLKPCISSCLLEPYFMYVSDLVTS